MFLKRVKYSYLSKREPNEEASFEVKELNVNKTKDVPIEYLTREIYDWLTFTDRKNDEPKNRLFINDLIVKYPCRRFIKTTVDAMDIILIPGGESDSLYKECSTDIEFKQELTKQIKKYLSNNTTKGGNLL